VRQKRKRARTLLHLKRRTGRGGDSNGSTAHARTLRQSRGRGDRNGSAHDPYMGRGGQGGASSNTAACAHVMSDEGGRGKAATGTKTSNLRQTRGRGSRTGSGRTLRETRGTGREGGQNGSKHAAQAMRTRRGGDRTEALRMIATSDKGDDGAGRRQKRKRMHTLRQTSGKG
jgi:hypothetical protein